MLPHSAPNHTTTLKHTTERWLTAGDVARLLEVAPSTMRRWFVRYYQQKRFEIRRTEGGHYRMPKRVALAIKAGTYEEQKAPSQPRSCA
jgi:prophage antirepressor-like protein